MLLTKKIVASALNFLNNGLLGSLTNDPRCFGVTGIDAEEELLEDSTKVCFLIKRMLSTLGGVRRSSTGAGGRHARL